MANIGLKLDSIRRDVTDAVRQYAKPLPAPERAGEFGALFAHLGDARVVLLGEATHGSHEFYSARAAISRELIQHHGFNIVAVEADWPDAASIDRYVRDLAPTQNGAPFARFPTWMWRNTDVMQFAGWLKAHNEGIPSGSRVSFHGLDVYSMSESIRAVIDYLDRVDPEEAAKARRRYGCLTPWQDDPSQYGKAVHFHLQDPCEVEVTKQLGDLLAQRLHYIEKDEDAFFNAAQNARIVRAAEQYYRAMYHGARESWNLRDRHMFETLQTLIGNRGPDAKAIVWAHNTHVGDAAATAMGWEGEFNIGELCRMAYHDDCVHVGFGTDRGTVAAASGWGRPMEIKHVPPAREDSYEFAFRKTGMARCMGDWRNSPGSPLSEALREPMLERAIGVVYLPETEYASHYFEAVLAEQFDLYIWFEETTAITPLPLVKAEGAPETYPFGL